jgi:hypothetical protein
MMKMTFSIPSVKQYTAPPIKIQPLANIQTSNINNTIIIGSIFQPIYQTGPCSSCGK